MDDIHVLWERCRSFHGHTCGGLLTGFLAALYASQLLGLHAGSDEGIVCISENDACGVDAIQVVLGCTVGRGSLLFHMTGKQAYSFYSRESGKSARLVLAGRVPPLGSMDIASYLEMYRPANFFTVKGHASSPPMPANGAARWPGSAGCICRMAICCARTAIMIMTGSMCKEEMR